MRKVSLEEPPADTTNQPRYITGISTTLVAQAFTMAGILKDLRDDLREDLAASTPEGDEFRLCSQFYRVLDPTLKALRRITETLGTAPGTADILDVIEKSLHWLKGYCDTFFENKTFQDRPQRKKCYEAINWLMARMQEILATFKTSDIFRYVLPDAKLCYGNLEYCEDSMEALESSLAEYPESDGSRTQKAPESHQQRRPVFRTPPGRLPVLKTPLERFPVLKTPLERFPVPVNRQERYSMHASRVNGLPASPSPRAPTSRTQRIHPNESERR
ncbi:unnamed protein product [Clonostachys solani]|uniref:Uncharacterized protein n=1 Tax=Clonostachys solani TaxID=160281 RepID=A0A9N9YZ22_9HYPO|nr:unnamed protein product [Clonostachys solani]